MEVISTPRFIISGISSRVGKSIISLGLAVALRKKNVGLSCCVIGPDLLQALILRRLSRRYVRCLDSKILSNGQILSAVHQAGVGADIIMIEGHDGLYDGMGAGSLRGSDSEIAALTHTPVVLVVDACGFGNSLAALVKGYSDFAQGFSITGVIANRLQFAEGEEERDKIYFDCAFESFGMQRLLGALPELDMDLPVPGGKVSQRSNKASLPLQFFLEVGTLVSEHVDIEELITRSKKAVSVRLTEVDNTPQGRRTKIAVADDNCFNICFQDNLDLLRHFGAEIISFSPVADTDLPKKIGAVYLTGAALSEYAADLENNESIRKSLRDFAAAGGVIYAEGAGAAFLCEEFESSEPGRFYKGVGIIPGRAVQENRPFLYTESVTIEESIIGRSGLIIKGVNTGEWRMASDPRLIKTLRTAYGAQSPVDEGYSPGAQMVATFGFMHWGSNPAVAKNIVEASRIVSGV